MNIFRKIKLFRFFKKTLSDSKVELEANYNLRIDRASRIYTVLNIPEDLYGEPYNLRKADIDKISETYIKEYISRLSNFLNERGLSEMYDFYEPIKKINKYSYLIILGFKPFDSVRFNTIIYYRILPILSLILLIFLIFLAIL
jgi:hypothetical protein